MNNQPRPLCVILEETRAKMTSAINQIVVDSKLPAYLIEGILSDLLSETRRQKNAELVADISFMLRAPEKPVDDINLARAVSQQLETDLCTKKGECE